MQTGTGLQRFRGWARSLPPWVVDAAIALIGGGAAVASTFGPTPAGRSYQDPDVLAYLLLGAVTVPYFLRSRYPFGVFSVSAVALFTYIVIGYNEGALPLLAAVGAYTVGERCSAAKLLAGFVLLVGGFVVLYLDSTSLLGVDDLIGNVAFYAAAAMLGWSVQSRRERMSALESRAAAMESQQAEAAQRAVADERLRIARELHDVMAHSMSVIAVQAGAGLHVLDANPAEAKRALENISVTSRSTLTELRRLLGVLRDESGVEYAPAPGLAELERLARDVGDAGVPVELHVSHGIDVPAGVDLTAYRIVQEALTNVLKHAGPARATVSVSADGGTLRIEVTDDGRGVNGRSSGTGHGLLGLRERVSVYGGTFSAGPVAGGGFRVVATLPWRDDEVAGG